MKNKEKILLLLLSLLSFVSCKHNNQNVKVTTPECVIRFNMPQPYFVKVDILLKRWPHLINYIYKSKLDSNIRLEVSYSPDLNHKFKKGDLEKNLKMELGFHGWLVNSRSNGGMVYINGKKFGRTYYILNDSNFREDDVFIIFNNKWINFSFINSNYFSPDSTLLEKKMDSIFNSITIEKP